MLAGHILVPFVSRAGKSVQQPDWSSMLGLSLASVK